MIKKQIKRQIPDKALKLLPWYAIDCLSAEESDYIKKIISEYPECNDLITAEFKIIDALKENKTILDCSCLETTEKRLEGILERLPAIDDALQSEDLKTKISFIDKISELFSGFSTNFQYAALASTTALVIGLSYAFIAPLVIEQDTVYHPANTSSRTLEKKSSHTVFLVGLNPGVTITHLLNLLNDNNAIIDNINSKNGMFRIRLSAKLNPEQTKNLLNKLTDNKELFWFAGEEF